MDLIKPNGPKIILWLKDIKVNRWTTREMLVSLGCFQPKQSKHKGTLSHTLKSNENEIKSQFFVCFEITKCH